MLSISLLGGFSIKQDQAPVPEVNTPRLQSLVAYLLLHRDAPQSRAHIAFLFWPDTSEVQARTNLRNLLHHLRHALPDADSYLDVSVQTLEWRREASFSLDVADFGAALAQARKAREIGDAPGTREALERAVALYKGDLLPSCYDDWILPIREALGQEYLDALEELAGKLEEQGDYPAAVRVAQRLLRNDPLREAVYRRLIRLHASHGDRAAALRVYHTCTTILQRELGVEPGEATREAYEQVLGLEWGVSPTTRTATTFSPLVGREREWERMLGAWCAVMAGGEPLVLMVRGEAGIGKTRLVEELVQWAARQGITSASARCYEAEGDLAFAPVTSWLRAYPLPALEDAWLAEVARLLPEVLAQRPYLTRPAALTEAWQRRHLFEALSRAILGLSQPLLLTIDDLQWCDRDTLEWLHFLLRFDRGARLLVVGAYRPEEIGENHPLVALLQAMRPEGTVAEVELPPLDEAATEKLAAQLAGRELSGETAQHLFRETEGNPLFVVEAVRVGLPDQEPSHETSDLGGSSLQVRGLPPRVKSMLEARLAQVSPPARELAGLAATIGREFSFKLLARAGGREEDTLVRELDELWQRRIVREHGVDGYDFSHDKLREVAYQGMSAARQRLLHRHIAEALEGLHAAELDPVSHQVAAHYENAGLPAQAAPYYLRAAEVVRRVYANDEAIALLRRGIALLGNVRHAASAGGPGGEVAAGLWESLGDLLELKAQHEEALACFRHALAGVLHGNRTWKARLHRKAGAVLREQRLYGEALDACRQAEVALAERPDTDSNPWWAEWLEVQVERVWAHYWLAQWAEMDTLVSKVQAVVQDRGGAASRVRFLNASCLMYLRGDRYVVSDEMLANSREALAASLECGGLKTRIECQFELGFLHLWRRELDEADRSLRVALELAEAYGILPLRTIILTYLTVVSRFRGPTDGVRRQALLAEQAAEAAGMPDYVAAARGNQAWVAWRERDLSAAREKGEEALTLWRQSPLVYPFQWQASWPLLGVALAQGRIVEACSLAGALLDSTQQSLPDAVHSPLEAAVQADARGEAQVMRSRLEEARRVASEMGYL